MNVKQKIVYLLCLGLMVLVGWGMGRSTKKDEDRSSPKQSDYTTNTKNRPQTQTIKPRGEETVTPIQPDPGGNRQPTEPKTEDKKDSPCIVKGNVSGKNKIYHIKDGAFYERTTPEQCFATIEEAEAAGFRKSSR